MFHKGPVAANEACQKPTFFVIGPVVFAPGTQTCTTELKKWSINVIRSGSDAYMKIDAKVCFQGDHLAAIFEVRSVEFGRNVDNVRIQCTYVNTMLEYSRANSNTSNSNETCRLMVTF
jgi:hypothetical protein